jgi:4-amino-4-deoxy-L-arabinose transferase-like glycosyltransferase
MMSQKTEMIDQVDKSITPRVSLIRVWIIILLVTALAAVLRLYKLGAWSFWVDEIFTLDDSTGKGGLGLYHGMTFPLSYILIGVSLSRFGISEWSARIVPALFGIATPAMIYFLARKSFGELTSIIATVIVAISPWHLYWSQMARFYTMTLFFSAASLLVLYKGLEEDKRSYIIVAGILMVLGALSHYSALLILVAILAYGVVLMALRWSRPLGFTLNNWLIYLAPFIAGAILVGARASSLLAKYTAGYPTGTTFSNPIKGAIYMLISTGYRLEPAIAFLALVGALIGLPRRSRGVLFLACAVIVPIVLLVISGMMSHAENRYAFVTLPAAALLAGSVISSIVKWLWNKNRLIAATIPVALLIPMLQHDVSYFGPVSNGERWNYRAAAEYLRDHADDDDIIYSSMWTPLAYYLKDTNLVVQDLNVDKDVRALPGGRAWLVMEDATRGESISGQLAYWLYAGCDLEAHFPANSPVADYGLSIYRQEDSPDKL